MMGMSVLWGCEAGGGAEHLDSRGMELARDSASFEGSGVGTRVVGEAKFLAVSMPGSVRQKRAGEVERLLKTMMREEAP